MNGLQPRVAAGSLMVGAILLIAAAAAWPIYRSWSFLLLVGVATLVAAVVAAFAAWRRWGGWLVAVVLAVAVLLLGVPLAVPSRLGAPAELLRGLGEVATGATLAWKDLVTVDLPVGSYRNLLVPALVVFLVGTCVALLLSWRSDRLAFAAALVAVGMVSFGLFFGRATASAPLRLPVPWGSLTLYAPVETALGTAGLVALLLWLAWRTRDERMLALRRAADSSGVRMSRRPTSTDRRRAALGAGMLVAAVAVAAAVVPFAARGDDRDVLRSAVGPEIDISRAVSPLAEYRTFFDDERAEDVLFTVAGSGTLPERVRLATLDAYDGQVFRSGGAGSAADARFVRVPSVLDAGDGEPVDVTISIEALDGIWAPTVGQLSSVEFAGERAASLTDRFYYRAGAAAAVQTAGGGLSAGDSYRLSAVVPAAPDLASIEAPGRIDDSVVTPDSLRSWVAGHRTGSDGAALAALVQLLRDRGYLSHALLAGETTPAWAEALPGYVFQPSAAGHSLARVDALFERLLERESDPRAAASDNYVAAVGDDEQFAVAVALIARELGFPSRVVVGVRLTSADPAVAVCDVSDWPQAPGQCRARDLSAWTEVLSADGAWIPIDATPQFEQSPSLEVTEQRDPENVTVVNPDPVEEVVPPDPVQEDSRGDDQLQDDAVIDLTWLWPLLRTAGIVLLLLLLVVGPFVVVIAAKRFRRRDRRTQGTPAARIAGGWDEYVDAAIDAGREVPRALTRREIARVYATASGEALATDADRAVFSSASVTDADAEEFWRIVSHERRGLIRGRGFWRAVAATVSLRSFVRHLAPVNGAGQRFVERGKRRVERPARTSP